MKCLCLFRVNEALVPKLALRHAQCTCVKPGYVDCGAAVGQ